MKHLKQESNFLVQATGRLANEVAVFIETVNANSGWIKGLLMVTTSRSFHMFT